MPAHTQIGAPNDSLAAKIRSGLGLLFNITQKTPQIKLNNLKYFTKDRRAQANRKRGSENTNISISLKSNIKVPGCCTF